MFIGRTSNTSEIIILYIAPTIIKLPISTTNTFEKLTKNKLRNNTNISFSISNKFLAYLAPDKWHICF